MITQQRRLTFKLILFCSSALIVAMCFGLQSAQAAITTSNKPLSDDEVSNQILRGVPIENSVISAQAIIKAMDAIRNLGAGGEAPPTLIALRGCVIKGKLSLRDIPIPLSIAESVFEDIVDFSQTSFERVTFAKVEFQRTAYFNRVKFPKGVLFAESVFREAAAFNSSVFLEHSDFDRVEFKGDLDLKEIQAPGQLHFKQCFFRGKLDASQAVINQLSFLSTEFSKDALFIGITNKEQTEPKKHVLEFSDVIFRGRVFFNNTKIENLWFTKDWGSWGLWEVKDVACSAPLE